MNKSSVITCLAEITSRCLCTSYPQPELFKFLHDELVAYDTSVVYDRDFLIRFLVSLSHHLGFGLEVPDQINKNQFFDLLEGHMVQTLPSHDYLMDHKDVLHLQTILKNKPPEKADVALDDRRKLIDLIILYYQLHIETLREVHSLKILRELF